MAGAACAPMELDGGRARRREPSYDECDTGSELAPGRAGRRDSGGFECADMVSRPCPPSARLRAVCIRTWNTLRALTGDSRPGGKPSSTANACHPSHRRPSQLELLDSAGAGAGRIWSCKAEARGGYEHREPRHDMRGERGHVGRDAEIGTKGAGRRRGMSHFHAVLLLWLMSLCDVPETVGWIALSKDGYVVTRGLGLQNGTLVEGDMLVSGVLLSSFNHTHVHERLAKAELLLEGEDYETFSSQLTGCTQERVGGLRWSSDKDLEGCTESGIWAPIRVCDRMCGYTGPPLPALRMPERGGPIDCSITHCTPLCGIRNNPLTAPTLAHDTCSQLIDDFADAHPQDPACRNLTVADLIENEMVSADYPGTSGVTLVQQLYSASAGSGLSDIYKDGMPTAKAATVVLCIVEPGETCETFTDRPSTKFPLASEVVEYTGLMDNLCTISIVDGDIKEVISMGKVINWAANNPARLVLWRAPLDTDFTWQKQTLKEALPAILEALIKVESVWDEPAAEVQGIVPTNNFTGKPEIRTCEDYNFSSPAFDYLRVFYNETGWEQLFTARPESGARQTPQNVTQCAFGKIPHGTQVVRPPWIVYNRLKNDWMKDYGAISSGFVGGKPVRYEPLLFNGTYLGNNCTFTIAAPLGFTVQLTIQYLILGENDTLTIVSGEDFPDDEKFQLPNGAKFNEDDILLRFVGPPGVRDSNLTNSTYTQKRFNYPISLKLQTTNESSAPGFLMLYDFVPRSEILRQQANGSQHAFALSVLEAQGADLTGFEWGKGESSLVGEWPPGLATLGLMTDAEMCFACCVVKDVLDQDVEASIEYNEARASDGGPLPDEWSIRPPKSTLGATSYLVREFVADVLPRDIPPLVAYMGYKPQHFFRTNFVSYLPPGSIKAPYGKPLGERVAYRAEGVADHSQDPEPRVRDEIGWGMTRLSVEMGGNFTDRSRHGWGEGWGVGDSAGKGTFWRDGDGAADFWVPSWQLLVHSTLIGNLDLPRFDFDLDHADVPLFSWVDAERRIVVANEIALALPCGSIVNNTCGVSCHILGTGLNRLQCITNQKETRCNQPVVDECNNDCGIEGTRLCEASLTALGAIRLRSLAEDDMTASFAMTVGARPRASEDNYTRSEDITGLAVDGVALGAGGIEAPAWGRSSPSQSSPDIADNALYFSFDDPAEEPKSVTFDIFGVQETLKLSREDFRAMVVTPIALEVPIECDIEVHGVDKCKLTRPHDDVSQKHFWWSGVANPSWDANADKRMDHLELAKVIKKNVVFFSIAAIKFMRACRQEAGVLCTSKNEEAVAARALMEQYGRRDTDGMPCSKVDVFSNCYMALDDIMVFLTEHEAFRQSFKQTLFSLPRFQMAKLERMGGQGGFEIGSPDPTIENEYNHNTNSLRISTYFQATGEYVRLGSSRYINETKISVFNLAPCLATHPTPVNLGVNADGMHVPEEGVYPYGDGLMTLESAWKKEVIYLLKTCPAEAENLCHDGGVCNVTFSEWFLKLDTDTMSHVFFDGVVEEEVPMVFHPADWAHKTKLKVETKREGAFGRPWIETPKIDPVNPQSQKGERSITLPDASGVMVTSGNLATVKRLPGLRKRSSFTPYRYDAANILHLDDARKILGGTYDYKTFQGSERMDCGSFEDGTRIECHPLKIMYDALESSASQTDEVLKFTNDKVLQASGLTDRMPDSAIANRLDCSSYRQFCDAGHNISAHQFLRFIPKHINVCYKAYGQEPCRCTKGDGTMNECQSCRENGFQFCFAYSVFGGTQTLHPNTGLSMGWNDFESFTALWKSEEPKTGFDEANEDWVFPFDTHSDTADQCSSNMSHSSNYTFLHIYYGTERGIAAWTEMGLYLNETREGRALPSDMPVQYAALKYLYMQGIAAIEFHEPGAMNEEGIVDNIGRLDLHKLWYEENKDYTHHDGFRPPSLQYSLLPLYSLIGTPGQAMTQFGFRVTDAERCVACCDFYAGTRVTANFGEETSCPYVNVSGFDEAEAMGGVYELMHNRSFGFRAWKQTPGDYFLHMLPLACTSRPQCGSSILDIPKHVGPAWVIGGAVGSDSIVAFASLDFDANVTGTELEALRRQAALNPSSSYLKWFEHRSLGGAMPSEGLTSGYWSEIQGLSTGVGSGLTVACMKKPVWQFSSTQIEFEDATVHTKLSIPDADGQLISTGNLEMITALGTQVSPILGQSTFASSQDQNSTTTRIKFGVGWQTVNVTELNDNLDFDFTTRNLSYCQIPNITCRYVEKNGQFSYCSASDMQAENEFRALPTKALEHCAFNQGVVVPGSNTSVDILVMLHQDEPDCLVLFEIDESFRGDAEFEELNGTQCALGKTVILVKDTELSVQKDCLVAKDWEDDPQKIQFPFDSCKTLDDEPPIPGIISPADAATLHLSLCPTYDKDTLVLDEECKDRFRAACKQACLRERGCVAAQPFLRDRSTDRMPPDVRCYLVMDSCEQVSLLPNAPFETWMKISGGWTPSRLSRLYPLNLPVGATLSLQDLEQQSWMVHSNRQQSIQLSWNLTSFRHSKVCANGFVSSGMVFDNSSHPQEVVGECPISMAESAAAGESGDFTCRCPTESSWAQHYLDPGDKSIITTKEGVRCCDLCASHAGLPAVQAWNLPVHGDVNIDIQYTRCGSELWSSSWTVLTSLDDLDAVVGDLDAYGNPMKRLLCKCSPRRMPYDDRAFSYCEKTFQDTFSTAADGHNITLNQMINLTSAVFPITVPVHTRISMFGGKMIRVGLDLFKILMVDTTSTSVSLLTIEPVYIEGAVSSHPKGSPVIELSGGGMLNVSFSGFRVQVPHGIYTLENITSTLNAKIVSALADRQFSVSFQIVEPKAGLCGEKIHGATRDVQSFHCAPMSRYFEMSGGIKFGVPSKDFSDDDVIHVLKSSQILETLGIHRPHQAYTFGKTSNRELPPRIVQHQVLPGAGYLSSGYGKQSGFGFGGQAGWTNSVPPTKEAATVFHMTWCHDKWSPGFQCTSSSCSCEVPVVTYSKILGTTKTQRGQTPRDNVIHVPSSANGIVLSTGNLEDVRVESSHATALRIDALREHEKTVAMSINGWLEFASCNNVFDDLCSDDPDWISEYDGGCDTYAAGAINAGFCEKDGACSPCGCTCASECGDDHFGKDCSLIDTDASSFLSDGSLNKRDVSIALDSNSSVAFHLWEKQVMWIALHNASDDLRRAALYGDSTKVWDMLPNEMNKANKTFSALQDEDSLAKLPITCNRYCDALMSFEAAEASSATEKVANSLTEASHLVELTIMDQIEVCAQVTCANLYTGELKGQNFSVAEHGNRTVDVCTQTCTESTDKCRCTGTVGIDSVCRVPHQRNEGLARQCFYPAEAPEGEVEEVSTVVCSDAAAVHLWLATIQGSEPPSEHRFKLSSQILNSSVIGYERCMGFLSTVLILKCSAYPAEQCLPSPGDAEPFDDCCSVLHALDVQRAEEDAEITIGGLVTLMPSLIAERDHALQQLFEAQSRCVCVEIEGSNDVEKGGRSDVERHICHEVPGISDRFLMEMGDGAPYEIPAGVCVADAGPQVQLGFNGSESRTVFHFPRGNAHVDYLTMPYTNGAVLTSGNLDAVTKEAGSMTSLHVRGMTDIMDVAHVGIIGSPAASQGSRRGSASPLRTAVDTISGVQEEAKQHCQGTDVSGTAGFCVRPQHDMTLMNNSISLEGSGAKTNLSYAHEAGDWAISFPTWDDDLCTGHKSSSCEPRDELQGATLKGRIITTGNLEEIEELSPFFIRTGFGHTQIEGPIELGSGYSCELPGVEPRSVLTKAHVMDYPYAVWSAFVGAQCVEMQDHVDWTNSLNLELSECKETCVNDTRCGAVVMKKDVDRSPQGGQCIVLHSLASECTVKSLPGQDLYLLVREAPSPWFAFEGNDKLFDSICSNFRTNLTHVPGTPIRFGNFLGGDFVYRESDPYAWAEYRNYRCDTFNGFNMQNAVVFSKEQMFWQIHILPQGESISWRSLEDMLKTQQGWESGAVSKLKSLLRDLEPQGRKDPVILSQFREAYQMLLDEYSPVKELQVTSLSSFGKQNFFDFPVPAVDTALLTGFPPRECLTVCENMPECSTVTVSSDLAARNRTCVFDRATEVRRTLHTWETLAGPCKRVQSKDHHLYLFKHDEQILFQFEAPSAYQTIEFMDTSGVIITTGNLHDVRNGVGLSGPDLFVSRTPLRDLGLIQFDPMVPNQASMSSLSGKEPNMIVRSCELMTGCMVYASSDLDDDTMGEKLNEHVPKKDGVINIDARFPKGVRGKGSGFDFFETIVDVAKPGTRLEGECIGECKGNFPCQRATFMCHSGCAGYMFPRTGIAGDEECAPMIRGSSCGCANGKPYGKFGTSVCLMPNTTHVSEGKFCMNTTKDGSQYELMDCCPDPTDLANCGKCIAYDPIIPTGLSQRLTLPEANGTIITTGNVDDLVLDVVKLESLFLINYMNFGNQFPLEQNTTPTKGEPSGYRLKQEFDVWAAHAEFDPVSSRVVGALRMIAGYGHPNITYPDMRPGKSRLNTRSGSAVPDPATALHLDAPTLFDSGEPLSSLPQYQQRYCIESEAYHHEEGRAYTQEAHRVDPERCRFKREILLPDVSGTILTTGNLLETPSMAIPREDLILSSSESKLRVWGNTTWGRRVNYTHDPFNHHYNHELGEVAFLREQFQSNARMWTPFNGDVGLTFQSAGHEIPQITFSSTEGRPDHPWRIEDYGHFAGPSPFGGSSPTEEVSRFARDGRAGDNRTELWNEDRLKMSFPMGGGVDKALRYFLRGGAPLVAVSVQDHMSATPDLDSLRDHFGYRSGRPALQMRSPTFPSDVATHNNASQKVSPALKGSFPINESWCYHSMQELGLIDAALTRNEYTTTSSLAQYLMSMGLMKQTQIKGAPIGSPAYSGDLSGNRIDDAACGAFAKTSLRMLQGASVIGYNFDEDPITLEEEVADADGKLVVVSNTYVSTGIDFYQNKSSISYGPEPHCGPIQYNSTYQNIRMLKFGIGCKEHVGTELLPDVINVEKCFEHCVKMESGLCSGFVLFKSAAHVEKGFAGSCRFVSALDSKRCTLTSNPQEVKFALFPGFNYTSYNVTLRSETVGLIHRDCTPGKDYDFSTSKFDPFRSQYGVSEGHDLQGSPRSDAEFCYVCCILNTSTSDLVNKAFDNDVTTYHSYHEKNGAMVGLDLGPSRGSVVTSIRFFPRPSLEASMVGGVFQGSTVSESEGFEDLHIIKDRPPSLEFTMVEISNPTAFRWLRYVGPNGTFGDVAEIEFHRGVMVEELSDLQSGNVSWNVDEELLQKEDNVQLAMLVKCAANGMLPAALTSQMQEVTLPHSQGTIITTGNLEAISKESGSFSSINVADEAVVAGSAKLGDPLVDTLLEVNSVLSSLSFRGPLVHSHAMLQMHLSHNPLDASMSLPDHSGTLVVGGLPSVINTINVLPSGGIDFDWGLQLNDKVTFGSASQGAASLDVLASLGDAFPLKFGGTFHGDHKVSVGSPQASRDSILTLPDASGTILTTGSIPRTVGNLSAIDHTILKGGTTFNDIDVEIGEQGLGVGLHLNANIMGFTSLTFDGTTRKDGKTLVLSAADPESNNEITLPDTTGTVITTANFPTMFDSLRTLGRLHVSGNAIADSDLIRIGGLERLSHVSVKAYITGTFPLVFDGGISNGGSIQGSTTMQVPKTSRHNIITFPDISGTVITSNTLPARTLTIGTYTIGATELLLTSQQISFGLSSKLSGHLGSFHFADSFAREHGNEPERENHFMVHALGGVSFVTGTTARGKKTGAFLRPGSSAWYYLSDADAKTAFQEVNGSAIAQGLLQVPMYRWQYSGNKASGHVHLGPMAQDMHRAFSLGEHSDRISASDADGVAFAAIKGLYDQIARLNTTADQCQRRLEVQRSTLVEQRAQLQVQDEVIRQLSLRMHRLWKTLASQAPVGSLPRARLDHNSRRRS